jgi:hypothetical protein
MENQVVHYVGEKMLKSLDKIQLIGKRVRINHRHWLRANSTGTLYEWNNDLRRWSVEFDEAVIGKGFNGGKYLFIEESDLEFLDEN